MCHLVICGWKQIVFSILVGSLEKKLLSGGPSFRLVKECFLEDLRPFATSISDLSFSVMWHRWNEGVFNFRHLCFLVCFAWNFRIQIRGKLKMIVLNSECLYKLAGKVFNVSSAFRFVQTCDNYQINKKRTV